MGKKKKLRHAVKKACKDIYVHEFADRVRRLWPDQKIYDQYHRPISQELIDTCAQEMLEDVIAVLAPHFRKPTNEKIARILHDWYDNQDTVNTRSAAKIGGAALNEVPVEKMLKAFSDIEKAKKDGTYVIKCPACGSVMDVHPNADCFAICTNQECGMSIRA